MQSKNCAQAVLLLSNWFSASFDEPYVWAEADPSSCRDTFFIRNPSLWAYPLPILYKTFTTISKMKLSNQQEMSWRWRKWHDVWEKPLTSALWHACTERPAAAPPADAFLLFSVSLLLQPIASHIRTECFHHAKAMASFWTGCIVFVRVRCIPLDLSPNSGSPPLALRQQQSHLKLQCDSVLHYHFVLSPHAPQRDAAVDFTLTLGLHFHYLVLYPGMAVLPQSACHLCYMASPADINLPTAVWVLFCRSSCN